MDDFPSRIADALESIALRIRSLTVDRVSRWLKWAALGLVIATLAGLGVLFLLIGLFRIVGEITGVRVAYAALGGLFVVAGAFLWWNRNPRSEEVE